MGISASSDFLHAVTEAPRAADADAVGREPMIELIDVDVKDLAILRAAARIGRPHERPQRLGVDARMPPHQVEYPELDRRQRDVRRDDGLPARGAVDDGGGGHATSCSAIASTTWPSGVEARPLPSCRSALRSTASSQPCCKASEAAIALPQALESACEPGL